MAVLATTGVATVFALAAIGVAVLALAGRRRLPLLSGPVFYFMAGLATWSLLSWWWSIAPDETLKTGASLALSLFGGAVLIAAAARFDNREREIFRAGLIVAGVAGFALIAFEFATDAWLSRHFYTLGGIDLFRVHPNVMTAMNPGLAATALFFWPWVLATRTRFSGTVGFIAAAVGIALILLGESGAVAVGVVAGAVVFAVASALPRPTPLLLAAAIAVGVTTAPLIPGLLPDPSATDAKPTWLSPSAAHRIVVWKTAAAQVRDHPVLGCGLDSARALYGGNDRAAYQRPRSAPGKTPAGGFAPMPSHLPNGILQVWLELGSVGAAIVLGLLLAVVRAIATGVDDRIGRAGALAMATTALTIASVGVGAWQSWWLASVLLAVALLAAVIAPAARAAAADQPAPPPAAAVTGEIGGPKGPEPTRYGDWERKGRAIDF